jgi:predicted transcriptional regulator YheO
MEKREINPILLSFAPIVKGIAKTFGKDCEVLLHDTSKLESSVIMIENGHVTGRKIGSPMTDLGLYFLQSDLFKDTDFIANYQTENKYGKKLKSTTIFIRDKKKKTIGFLCINYVLDYLSGIRKKIDDFCEVNKDVDKNVFNNEEKEEIFTDNIDDLLERVFIKAQEKVGKPIEKMQKDDKLEVVRYLQKKGFFLIKGNIDKIAIRLNVSRYTIYNYLSEIKPEKNIKLI